VDRAMKRQSTRRSPRRKWDSTASSSPSTRLAPSSIASSTSSSRVATEGHMDALTMADTVGVCTPDAVAYAVKKVSDRLKKPVEIHCYQDFGLGVANTISALAAGASVAHTTITGLGERAGNVPMGDVVLSLLWMTRYRRR